MARTPGNDDVARQFTSTFSRSVSVHFLGLWDTVTSTGNIWAPIHWPNAANNPSVEEVSHAIAIDERRSFFRQNRWGGPVSSQQKVSELWFAGVHSDVGGGYPAKTGRLWAITLDWMAQRACAAGLRIDGTKLQAALDSGKDAWVGTPDFATDQHDSLTLAWKPLELVPKPHSSRNPDGSFGRKRLLLPFLEAGFSGRPRTLSGGDKVHRSAIERFVRRADYRPPTLVDAGLTVDDARKFLESGDDSWTVPRNAAGDLTK
jgi:hypothetical protein